MKLDSLVQPVGRIRSLLFPIILALAALSLAAVAVPARAAVEGILEARVSLVTHQGRMAGASPSGMVRLKARVGPLERFKPDVICRVRDIQGPAAVLWGGRQTGTLAWRREGEDLVCELPFRRDDQHAYQSEVRLSFKTLPTGSMEFVGHVEIDPIGVTPRAEPGITSHPAPPAAPEPDLLISQITTIGVMEERSGRVEVSVMIGDESSFPERGPALLEVTPVHGPGGVCLGGAGEYARDGQVLRIARTFTRDTTEDFIGRIALGLTDGQGRERIAMPAPGVSDSFVVEYWTGNRLSASVTGDRKEEGATIDLLLEVPPGTFPEAGEATLEMSLIDGVASTWPPETVAYQVWGTDLVVSRPVRRDADADLRYRMRLAVTDRSGKTRIFPMTDAVTLESRLPPPPPMWPWIAAAAALLVVAVALIRFRSDVGALLFMIGAVFRALTPGGRRAVRPASLPNTLSPDPQPALTSGDAVDHETVVREAPHDQIGHVAGSVNETIRVEMENDVAALAKRLLELQEMAAPGRHAANDVDPDAALVATVNRWWDEGSGDREQLRRLASRIGLQARFYVLPHGTDELLDFSSREVMVEPADEHGGWFGCTSADPDELFLLPADHRYFSGITSRTLVRRLFHGTDGTQGMAGCRARQVARLRRRSGTRFEIVAPGTLSSPGSPERIDDVPGYERFREHPEDPARIAEQLVQLRSELREVQNALRLLRARVESESDAEIPHP